MQTAKRVIILVMFFHILALWGCARPGLYSRHMRIRIEGMERGFAPGTIVRTKDCQAITFEELLEDLKTVQIVYVGERHANQAHHEIQLKLIQALFEIDPNLMVGMEMFDRSYQAHLDEWSSGSLDEKGFLRKVAWNKNWNFDIRLYRPIINFVRDKHIKLVALNVPHQIIRKIVKVGLEGLSSKELNQVAKEIYLSDKAHINYVRKFFKYHTGRIKDFSLFYEAQCVWDDSMAETIVRFLGSSRMVVLAGRGHVDHKFGIPDRVSRRLSLPYRTIIPVDEGETVLQSQADYIWTTRRL
nr:hypothetical protein [Desulfobacterales bacterium]